MANSPTDHSTPPDERIAVAELLAYALDRCGIEATADVMDGVIRRHGAEPSTGPRVGGARFRKSSDPTRRNPEVFVREQAYAVCVTAHGAFITRHPDSHLTVFPFLQAAIDDRIDPDPALCVEAAGLVTEELGKGIARESGSATMHSVQIVVLLTDFQTSIQQHVENVRARADHLKVDVASSPSARALRNTDDPDESIIPVENASYALYNPDTNVWSKKRASIFRLSSLKAFARLLLRIVRNPSRDSEPLITALTDVAQAWETGRTVRLFNSDPGRPLEVHLTVGPSMAAAFAPAAADVSQPNDPDGDAADEVTGPPVPSLSDDQVEAIKERARNRPWSGRGPNPPTPFEWVRDNYREWIPGLLQSHLQYDPQLYSAFSQRVRREGLPAWLDVPTEPDAKLRNTTDPDERRQLLEMRRASAERARQRRASGLVR